MALAAAIALALSLGSAQGLRAGGLETRTAHAALATDGTVYRVHEGLQGDLFSSSHGRTDHPVLALDILRAGEESQRLLVPETDNSDLESTAAAVFESSSGSLFIVWISLFNNLHSSINLIAFDGENWSDRIEITGDAFSVKSATSLLITRDSFVETHDDTQTQHHRTILHTVWWEESGGGSRVRYTPLILVDGAFTSGYQIFDLLDFADEADGEGDGRARHLAPTLTKGTHASALIVAVPDPRNRLRAQLRGQVAPRRAGPAR